ncbi:MAG: class I SAM-dependent methyltransferase, partial [bacterium]|nr:class I SAM-dependent methyltransferase [bacterium]
MASIKSKLHRVEWTEKKIADMWDYICSNPYYNDVHFSNELGEAIVAFARKHGDVKGLVVDYACGPGYLIEHLLKAGVTCMGTEFADEPLEITKKKFGGHKLFRGALKVDTFPMAIPDASADFVFLVETVEHLLPQWFDDTIKELHRILKKGGQLYISTPYRETLDNNNVMCPDCNAVFHRMQHIKSWSEEELSSRVNAFGFDTVLCLGTTLWNDTFENRLKGVYRLIKR